MPCNIISSLYSSTRSSVDFTVQIFQRHVGLLKEIIYFAFYTLSTEHIKIFYQECQSARQVVTEVVHVWHSA
jgi:hypothetical protein